MLVFYSKSAASSPKFWPSYWKGANSGIVEVHMPEYATFRRHVPAGAKVLDAGCGIGLVTRSMLSKGYQAFGIDFDEYSVTRSSREYGYFPGAVADVTRLPFGPALFDAIFLCSVAEHVASGIETVFRECARALRPQGTLLLP